MSPSCGDRTTIFFTERNSHMVTEFGDEILVFIVFIVIGLLAAYLL